MDPIKIVVRFADGRAKKGFSQDFFPNKAGFHLIRRTAGVPNEPEEIRFSELKAVFFVKTFEGAPDYRERKEFTEQDSPRGRKVEVAFSDGEVLQGSVLGYNPKETGFFLFPVDPQSNNLRLFVINSAVKKMRFLEPDPTTKASNKSDYQCLLPEKWGKLLMLSEQERKLLRLVLARVMETNSGKEYIVERLGKNYLQVANDLLKEMGKD